ncbi:unnamed protein product [Ambrosiozyma monospora]|uniref:Unnamed protein product n=1 Tax=Ambrosiozyma monospora TaxID=43982 RepID=A0ACB5T586_AMBMO|nr:unnamed protein product [Ambrosiozyma monospora]
MSKTGVGSNSNSINPGLYGGLASTLLQQNTGPQSQLQSEPHTPILQQQQPPPPAQQHQNINDSCQLSLQIVQREYIQAGIQNGNFVQTSQSATPTIPKNTYTYPPQQNTVDLQSQKEIKYHVQTDIKYFTNLLESSSQQQNLNLNPQDIPSSHKLKHYATKAKFFYKLAHENLPYTGRIGHSLQFVLDHELPDLKADLNIWWSSSPSSQHQTVTAHSSTGQNTILPVPVPPIGKFDPVEWTPYYYHMLAEEVANVLLYNLNFTVAMKNLLSNSPSMGNVDDILGSPYTILTTMLQKELQDDDVPGLSEMMRILRYDVRPFPIVDDESNSEVPLPDNLIDALKLGQRVLFRLNFIHFMLSCCVGKKSEELTQNVGKIIRDSFIKTHTIKFEDVLNGLVGYASDNTQLILNSELLDQLKSLVVTQGKIGIQPKTKTNKPKTEAATLKSKAKSKGDKSGTPSSGSASATNINSNGKRPASFMPVSTSKVGSDSAPSSKRPHLEQKVKAETKSVVDDIAHDASTFVKKNSTLNWIQ